MLDRVDCEDGELSVTDEDDPNELLARMERLIAEASATREPEPKPYSELHPIAQNHADLVRRGAQRAAEDDE